jgi:hypothetical protein
MGFERTVPATVTGGMYILRPKYVRLLKFMPVLSYFSKPYSGKIRCYISASALFLYVVKTLACFGLQDHLQKLCRIKTLQITHTYTDTHIYTYKKWDQINNTNTAASQIVLFSWRHYAYILKFCFYLPYQIVQLQWKESRRLVLPRRFFICGMGWDWVHLVHRPLVGLLYQLWVTDGCGVFGEMRTARRNRNTQRKPTPVPLRGPQTPHDLIWVRLLGTAMGNRRLTAWVMARPFSPHSVKILPVV